MHFGVSHWVCSHLCTFCCWGDETWHVMTNFHKVTTACIIDVLLSNYCCKTFSTIIINAFFFLEWDLNNLLCNIGDVVMNFYINQEKKSSFMKMRSVDHEDANNAMAFDGVIFEVIHRIDDNWLVC